MTELRPLRASAFTIRMRCSGSVHKIFKIGYTRSDGSIWIAFPYFQHSRGLASLVLLPPGSYYPTASLTEQGKVTSHLVKYMHHRSGLALFSQSGKVVSSVRKSSVPLSSAEGHLVTITITDLKGFAKDTSGKAYVWDLEKPAPVEQMITFDPKSPEPPSVKFILRCYSKKRLRARVFGEAVGPNMALKQPASGKMEHGILMAAPKFAPGSTTHLILQAYRRPRETQEPGPHLTLVGGFDPPEISFDHTKPLSFLVLSYPAHDYDELQRTLGSIDFVRELKPGQGDDALSVD